ncbi:MAG: hypothetical protein IPK35_01830 [Saprospiraceae bacterium]|jgi:hypothetical protein|nr:hypothetical protein [Saprospiraceae bacterium]
MKAKNETINTFRIQSNILVVICSFIIVVLLSGCSVTGLLIGSQIKSKKNVTKQVRGWEINNIAKDKPLIVVLKNGDSISGFFKKEELMPLEAYSDFYTQKTEGLNVGFKLPRIGDSIVFYASSGNNYNQGKNQTISSIFWGFDYNNLIVQGNYNLPVRYPLNNIYSPHINFDEIKILIKSGSLPVRSILSFNSVNVQHDIRSYDIQDISYVNSKSKALPGFMLGLIIDFLILSNFDGVGLQGSLDLFN